MCKTVEKFAFTCCDRRSFEDDNKANTQYRYGWHNIGERDSEQGQNTFIQRLFRKLSIFYGHY